MKYLEDTDFTLYCGDVREALRELPAESVHCVVTSPPYWGLRDYGTGQWEGGDPDCDHVAGRARQDNGERTWNGGPVQSGPLYFRESCGKCGARRVDQQLGLEASPELFVENMVAVFREVRRVLRADGTCWVNMGDSYASNGPGGMDGGSLDAGGKQPRSNRGVPKIRGQFKPKDLCGVPWMLAFALRDDGWYLRSDVVWSKPNPMPESVTDRPTKSHEYIFLLSKRPRYFFDQEAVREPHNHDGRSVTQVVGGNGSIQHRDGERWPNAGRNVRSVWEIATQPYPEAHFATYPEELVRRCLLAGCPEWVCGTCGKPRTRETTSGPDPNRPQAKRALEIAEREGLTDEHIEALKACGISDTGKALVTTNGTGRNDAEVQALADHARSVLKGYSREFLIRGETQTVGWSDCGHNNYRPGVVLDPFMGSGTTALVARKHGRRSIGVELNPAYCELAARRLQQLSLLSEIA